MSPQSGTVAVTIDGRAFVVPEHTSVAAAILNREATDCSPSSPPWHVRTSVDGQPRGPLCGMGICFECRATVNGHPHERTCQLMVRDGMEIQTDG